MVIDIGIEYKKSVIRELLAECTDKQVDLFNKMYASVDEIAPDKLDWAVYQCERTVQANKKMDKENGQ